MLIAVDIGNTQTVIGIYDGDELVTFWRLPSELSLTSDMIVIRLYTLLNIDSDLVSRVDSAIISSVVPSITSSWTRALAKIIGCPIKDIEVVDASQNYGIKINYPNRKEIGPDRIADAIAAIKKYGYPCVIVDLGTATNIEVIDSSGAFIGGVIAPGIKVSADALFSNAARLAHVDLDIPEKVIGTSTIAAVQSGLTFGEAARVDGLVNMILKELGCEDATVVATGGLLGIISSLSTTIDFCDPLLTLDGLKFIHSYNCEN